MKGGHERAAGSDNSPNRSKAELRRSFKAFKRFSFLEYQEFRRRPPPQNHDARRTIRIQRLVAEGRNPIDKSQPILRVEMRREQLYGGCCFPQSHRAIRIDKKSLSTARPTPRGVSGTPCVEASQVVGKPNRASFCADLEARRWFLPEIRKTFTCLSGSGARRLHQRAGVSVATFSLDHEWSRWWERSFCFFSNIPSDSEQAAQHTSDLRAAHLYGFHLVYHRRKFGVTTAIRQSRFPKSLPAVLRLLEEA